VLSDFRAASSLIPGGIDVSWRFTAPGVVRPPFLLVRRLAAFPETDTDGLTAVRIDQLYQLGLASTIPWPRIEWWRFLCRNGPAQDPELVQAGLELYFLAATGVPPDRAVVSWFDRVSGTTQQTQFDEVSRVVQTTVAPAAPFTSATQLEIFITPGAGPEVTAGTITISDFTGLTPPAPPDALALFQWSPAGGTPVSVPYHALETRTTAATAGDDFVAQGGAGGAQVLQRVRLRSTHDADADATEWAIEVGERGLVPGRVYYYRLFTPGFTPLGPDTAQALATGSYGMPARMFQSLPPVLQLADLDTPSLNGAGQLERFLSPFGAAFDHLRGLIDALPARHAAADARVDLLPHLSRMIGWNPDLTASGTTQRTDLGFAPELFAAVGAVRNPPAVVRRVTGWPTSVKEFARNVMLTNAPEAVPLREIWHVSQTAGVWSAPDPVTLTTSVDADPVAVSATGVTWLIWHSTRSGRRELWYQRLGVDAGPRRVMAGAPDDAPDLAYSDHAPTALPTATGVDLFWASDRAGSLDIWTRPLAPAPGAPTQLTDHAKSDRHPAVVAAAGGPWLFWDSDRRGVWDIWSRRFAAGTWGPAVRLLKDAAFDRMGDSRPAAVIAPTGDLWLFWCRDMADRREIWHQVNTGGVWGPQVSLSSGLAAGQRDEAPCPIVRGGRVLLLMHSNRGGPWQIWGRVHDGLAWQAVARLSNERTADLEPTGFEVGGQLQVFWSSARRTPWYRSRTIDFGDTHMLAEMGTFDDHTHYSYDTGTGSDDWYARGTVGLYLTPDTADTAKIADNIGQTAAFLEPFRPAPVRFVWPLADVTKVEPIAVGGLLGARWSDGP
jgi:hypothetical protein